MREIRITAKDGALIPAIAGNFDGRDIKGVVITCYGLGEHAAMYLELAEHLGRAGYASLIHEQRGHGEPQGNQKKWFGVTRNYQRFFDDLDSVTEEARRLALGAPVALYGHSMGGNIVVNHLLKRTSGYACAILESPWLRLYKQPNSLFVGLAKIAGLISANATVVNKLNPNALTGDPDRVKTYQNDPLHHGSISFRIFNGINSGGKNALKNAAKLTTPIYLANAKGDRVVCNKAIHDFAAKAKAVATLKEYDCRHAIHNDVMREEFFKDVVAYLDEQCKTSPE